MPEFVLVGSGFPLRKLIKAIASIAEVQICAIFVDKEAHRFATQIGSICAARVMESAVLKAGGSDWLARRRPHWLIGINSVLVVPAVVLELFPQRALNCHPGLLPEYAGLHTHQWALRNGDTEFGVTIHQMERAIDTGPIVAQSHFPIEAADTGLSLLTRCLASEVSLCAATIERIAAGEALAAIPQDLSRRRLHRHCDALDGRIDWKWPAAAVVNFVRAGNYEPFESPTYVASLDPVPGFSVVVLRASVEGTTGEPPGTMVALDEGGPLMSCGDCRLVRLSRARNKGSLLDLKEWSRYFSYRAYRPLEGRSTHAVL